MSELDKKLMKTPDLNKERLVKLKSLFPDLFTIEGNLNPEELKKIIDPDLVKETERFEFKWFGKSEAKRLAFTPSKATLIYDNEKSVNPEYAEGNMIIEGENLETLKCLLAGYRERVKCIYIDPPYNTGKDFVYSDKWDENKEDYWEHIGVTEDGLKVDTNAESSGRYHSNWLSMMYPRLLLARQLLKNDGVIFISIDDNEAHHLRNICDEIFGEENFVANITVKANPRGRQSDNDIATLHDTLFCYSKNYPYLELNGLPLTQEDIDEFDQQDEDGKLWRELGLRQRGSASLREERPDMYFPIYVNPDDCSVSVTKTKEHTVEVYPKKSDGRDGRWMWGFDKTKNEIDRVYARIIKKRNEYDIFIKDYLERNNAQRTKKPRSIWIEKDVNTETGGKLLKQILPDAKFPYPKPVGLIKKIIQIATNGNSIILDSFAGSGTTAHSVLELNKEDGGNRKFILVQIPELTDEKSEAYKAGYKKISDITIERNKRVIQKIEKEEAEKQPSLLDSDKKPFKTGFKVYKLSKSNFPRVDFAPFPAKTEEENLALLNEYIDEKESIFLAMVDEKNILDEVLLKNGFMLNYSKLKVSEFSKNNVFQIKDDFKECLICMDMNLSKETLKELEQFKDKIIICLERALDTTMKWNLKHLLGDKLIAF